MSRFFPTNYFSRVLPERYFPLDVVILPEPPPAVIGGGGWSAYRGETPIDVVLKRVSGKNDDEELLLIIKAFLDAVG